MVEMQREETHVASRYLVIMEGCLEPNVHGPYKTDKSRDNAAKRLHKAMSEDDNLFAMDLVVVLNSHKKMPVVTPEVWTYSGGFFQEG
jgi:hypothetical protein